MSTMTEVRLQRTIQAPPDRVYRAWLDPDVLCRWLAPGSMSVKRVEADERVGGTYHIFQANADGEDVGGFEWEVLELVPAERIVFQFRFVGPERIADHAHDSRVTVTLRDAPGGATELTLVHDRLAAFAAVRPEVAELVGPGWEMALDKLVAAPNRRRLPGR
jgi:uncharacterized protein YndB with AHSA1/START domain